MLSIITAQHAHNARKAQTMSVSAANHPQNINRKHQEAIRRGWEAFAHMFDARKIEWWAEVARILKEYSKGRSTIAAKAMLLEVALWGKRHDAKLFGNLTEPQEVALFGIVWKLTQGAFHASIGNHVPGPLAVGYDDGWNKVRSAVAAWKAHLHERHGRC